MQQTEIDRVLSFWLEEVGPEGWYKPDEGVDSRIAREFGALQTQACAGRLRSWAATARGTLASLILIDQFSRNLYRGTAKAYAHDPLCLALTKMAIGRGFDLLTPEPERQFFYLPLEHSESLADQERAVRLFMMRMPGITEEGRRAVIGHRDVIRKFGRFPSRNAALGRKDKAAELAYREAGGYMG
ncbi:MAG: DUF924 family protein [Paracoccaceae bacterium]